MNLLDQPVELADIFREHFKDYLQHYGSQPKHHYTAANAIMRCRTEELGGHVYLCDECSLELILYNSCRNRHCPKCQALQQAKWVEKRMDEALPVPYFHVVFTLPHLLNPIALRNKKQIYTILFKAVSQTLSTLGNDPKYLGGQIGSILVLHTWGQVLLDHIHVHCIVPAGGYDKHDNTWLKPKFDDFLFPVPVMQKLFRAKFMDLLRKSLAEQTLNPLFVATEQAPTQEDLIKKLYTTKWVVHIEKPFAAATNVVKYLSQYTHRIAISNSRILKLENGKVTFSYKDYGDNKIVKTMCLDAVEFIRRFMLHIVPDGFNRIRQYGFLCNKVKKEKLKIIKAILAQSSGSAQEKKPAVKVEPVYQSLCCPACKKGTLKKFRKVAAVTRSFVAPAVND